MLAHLVGPLRRPAWRAVVCSLTGNLAKELRRQVEEIARASGLYDADAAAASRPPTGERIASYQTPQPGRIVGPDGDVTCLAADKATGHAVGADLAIVDEAGLLQEKHRDLWNAMQSCMSGRAGRLLAISIRGDGPMFAELRRRGTPTRRSTGSSTRRLTGASSTIRRPGPRRIPGWRAASRVSSTCRTGRGPWPPRR